MSLVIEHAKTKRLISGAYNVCGSLGELKQLRDALTTFIDNGGTYGWVAIETSGGSDGDSQIILRQRSIANTAPICWDAVNVA